MATTTKKKKKKTRKKGKHYFTQVHEDAIIEYINSTDNKRRNELYVQHIGPVIKELVEKIVYTFKFTNLPNIEILREECEVYLATVLSKYDPSKGSKAYSYFSVIAKHWFIQKVKKNAKKLREESQYEEISKAVEMEYMTTYNDYIPNRVREEFITHLWKEIEGWEKMALKPNERKVLAAIKILLEEPDCIDIFNKKAIYLYIREMTNLNTKQVANNLSKFRLNYAAFKKKWHEE